MSVADETDDRTSLEQVRELLFGTRARELTRRSDRIEASVAHELAELREELQRRLTEFETHVQRELEALSARLDAEGVARVEGVSTLGREMREANTSVELHVNRVDEAHAKNLRELRRQLLEHSQALNESVRKSRAELFAALESIRAEQPLREDVELEGGAERVSAH